MIPQDSTTVFHQGKNVMQNRIRLVGILVILLSLSAMTPTLAEITITTDKPSYELGEIVHITAHNAGPTEEQFVSDPFFHIANVDVNECVFGCVGLPVVTPFPVGETVSLDWDTGTMTLLPGNYSAGVVATNGASINFILTEVVATEASSWGALKALYR
jgi:hypothetical protein